MKKRFCIITIVLLMLMMTLQMSSFAVIDQAQLFIAKEWANNTYAVQATTYAVKTFQTLGYDIKGGLPALHYTITDSRSTILNYLSGTGNNYAFFVFAHGGPGIFTMNNSSASAAIRSSDITGYWHFVFINGCSCMSNDSFAQAFKTVGYSNRASLGWFDVVTSGASSEWWSYFKNQAGTTNLRSACLASADKCSNSTPIRIYGDKTWNGKAWNK